MSTWKPPTLAQTRDQYRYSADAWLLAAFAAQEPCRFFCDMGTGCGVVAYGLASASGSAGFALERNPVLCQLARENLSQLPVTVAQGDLRSYPLRDHAFDLVVCNPPYYEVGSGRINHNPAVAEARHTFYGGITDFAQVAQASLSPNGLFCFVFPAQLLARPLAILQKRGWQLSRRLDVHSFEDREARLVCVALSRNLGLDPGKTARLSLYREHRVYTDEALAFLSVLNEWKSLR